MHEAASFGLLHLHEHRHGFLVQRLFDVLQEVSLLFGLYNFSLNFIDVLLYSKEVRLNARVLLEQAFSRIIAVNHDPEFKGKLVHEHVKDFVSELFSHGLLLLSEVAPFTII